ncbi:MAG: hypothetical protein ACRYG2_24020, partial [Janthinobacterium lividum]
MFDGPGDTPTVAPQCPSPSPGRPPGPPWRHERLPPRSRAPACEALAAALPPVGEAAFDLGSPTPCARLDLLAPVDHFVGTTTATARLVLGEPLDP